MTKVFFLLIAILYASVGFGGGSGYIAVLSFSNLEPNQLRFIALCCNLVVVSGGTWLYMKNGLLQIRKSLPFIITSVPAALIGGLYQLESKAFFTLLALTLLLAGSIMIVRLVRKKEIQIKPTSILTNLCLGGLIGLVSGLVGIGGGIFLSPLLNLMRWDRPKIIAATASFFILVNSMAGLTGQLLGNSMTLDWKYLLPLLIVVFIGGQIGSRVQLSWLKANHVKAFTAVLVIFASLRMLYKVMY